MFRGKSSVFSVLAVSVLLLTGFATPTSAYAAGTSLSPHSWDPGLYATTNAGGTEVHAWGRRATTGAWGTGAVNYQSGATTSYRGNTSGSLSVQVRGTYCPGGTCGYGSGSGYKSLVQFWNDPNNFLAIGVIHDPGVSPSGTTLMIEGSANGRPTGGYWAPGALSGASHKFTFDWTAGGIRVTIDDRTVLGPYPVAASHPSISFLAAGRVTGDIADSTFSNISFTAGSMSTSPFGIPTGNPYLSYSASITESGTGTGHSSYINAHDAFNNALSIGIQTDKASPESKGTPYYVWELVQNGRFTYRYIKPAVTNRPVLITLKWWKSGTAIFYIDSQPIAEVSASLRPRLFFNVEGNARLNGDTVSDTFQNVQIAVGDDCPTYCGLNGSWNTADFNSYGLTATRTNAASQNGANFTVKGTVRGLPSGADWDTNLVGGIGMIAQYWNQQ